MHHGTIFLLTTIHVNEQGTTFVCVQKCSTDGVYTVHRYRHTCNIPTVNNKQNKVRFIFMIMIYMRDYYFMMRLLFYVMSKSTPRWCTGTCTSRTFQ